MGQGPCRRDAYRPMAGSSSRLWSGADPAAPLRPPVGGPHGPGHAPLWLCGAKQARARQAVPP
eukprot:6028190-Alexandrium_andersonii.AAC.1